MIVVFGATGYIGRYLCPFLVNEGYDVLGIGRAEQQLDFLVQRGVQIAKLDLTDQNVFEELPQENVEAIVYLATVLPEIEGVSLESIFLVNTVGVSKAFEYARKIGVKKVIVTSTHKLSNNVNDKEVITVNDIDFTGSHTPYIISKLAAEKFVKYYNDEFNMQGIVLRLTGVHGYGEMMGQLHADGSYTMSAFERFVGLALKGEDIEVWTGGKPVKRDHVYIKDVLKAISCAIKSQKAKGIYYVSSGKAYSQYEEALEIADIFSDGKNKSRVIERSDLPGLKRGYLYDISATKKDLDWEPEFVSLKDYLTDYKKEWEKKEYHHYHIINEEDKPATFNW